MTGGRTVPTVSTLYFLGGTLFQSYFFLKKQFLIDIKFTWTKDSPGNIGKE